MSQKDTGTQTDASNKSSRIVSQVHQVSLAVVVASSFDALVRATRQREGGLTGMASRVLDAWLQKPKEPLILKPDGLWFQETLGQVVDAQACGWLLPAFMTGVREIRLEEQARPEDFVRLAKELGMLELGGNALEAFMDWLWADGAEGFDVTTSLSFSEVFELLDTGEMSAVMFGSGRAESLVAMDATRVALPSAELAIATLRPEFHTALDMFCDGARYRAFELDEGTVNGLSSQLDDGGHWTWAETDAILEQASLRAASDPWRLARRLVSRIREGSNTTLLERLGLIYGSDEPFFVQVCKALEQEGVVGVVSRTMDLSSPDARGPMLEWMRRRDAPEHTVWSKLCDRVVEDGQVDELALLLRERGVIEVRACVDEAELSGDAARVYALSMRRAGCTPETIASLLMEIDVDASAHALLSLDDFYMNAMDRPLMRVLMSASNVATEVFIPALLERGQPELLHLVGQALNTRRPAWIRKVLGYVCNALLDEGLAMEYLVPLVRRRSAGEAAREVALDMLRRDEVALAEAVKFRLSEFFEPQSFRDRIKSSRTRLENTTRTPEDSP